MRSRGLYGFLVLITCVSFLAAVQFATPNLVDNDGFYHIKMAYLMRTSGLKPAFDWLPLTILNAREFVDHHFLFHILLIPFTFGDLRIGAKLASVFFPALAFLAIWWLLQSQDVPLATLWSFGLLAVSEAFIYRMSMPRAQSLSLAVLALGLHWLFKKRYVRLLILSFLYVWMYDAFPLILALAILYSLACLVRERRLVWKPVACAGLGVILGLVINPYFPANLIFLFRHLSPKLANATATSVGSEWYPYLTDQLVGNSGLALAAFLAGVFALGLSGQQMDAATTTGLFVVILFGGMLFKSRRFVEYFPAFSLIFAGLAWKPILYAWFLPDAPPLEKPSEVKLVLHRWSFSWPAWLKRSWLAAAILTLLLIPAIGLNLFASRDSLLASTIPYQTYEGASIWLRNNTPKGARVFQTDWDDFPRLFFYNTYNTYTIGLDPTYMQLYDEKLYDEWVGITQGRYLHSSQVIRRDFGASFILTDLLHNDFLRQARQDPGLVEVYRDQYAAVFRIASQ